MRGTSLLPVRFAIRKKPAGAQLADLALMRQIGDGNGARQIINAAPADP